MTAMKINLSPNRMSTITIVADQLSKQAEWKAWVAEKFTENFELGLSRSERVETIAVYQRILLLCDAAKAEKDAALKAPKAKDKAKGEKLPDASTEAFVHELSWLQKIEHKVKVSSSCSFNADTGSRRSFPRLNRCCRTRLMRSLANSVKHCARKRRNKQRLGRAGSPPCGVEVATMKSPRRKRKNFPLPLGLSFSTRMTPKSRKSIFELSSTLSTWITVGISTHQNCRKDWPPQERVSASRASCS